MIHPAPVPVVIALGSNVGDRRRHLRTAIHLLSKTVKVVRLSSVWESHPMDCPPGAGLFLNMALSGVTVRSPESLLAAMHDVEKQIGRRRLRRNESRRIDLDLIFYGARLSGRTELLIPHPRYHERSFVIAPLGELGLDWTVAGRRVSKLDSGEVLRRVGTVY